MASIRYLIVGVVLLYGDLCLYQAAAQRQCLQCERVTKPEDCLQRVRCAPGEACFTEQYVTNEGHVFYDMGCKLKTTCSLTSYDVSKAELDQRVAALHLSPHAIGRRQNIGEPMAAHVCEECCDFDHCNDLLCGGHSSKGLKCVHCTDMQDMAVCEKVRGCHGHEMCFIEERITDKFELLYSSGCMREIQCKAFAREKQSGGGFFEPCFKCCNETFCNAQCETPTTPAPTTTTTTMAGTASTTPPMPKSSAGTTAAPPSVPPTGSPAVNAKTSAGTPPPMAGR